MSTLSSFARMLRKHDWFYDYSDDHRVWCKGRDNWSNIQQTKAKINEMGQHKAQLGDALFLKYKPEQL